MYQSRNIFSKRLMKQLYFSFIHSYLNYANIARGSTSKPNLISFYCNQKHAIRIIYDKDHFAHAKPLFKNAQELTVCGINLFQSLSLIFKCKNRTATFNLNITPKDQRKWAKIRISELLMNEKFRISFET